MKGRINNGPAYKSIGAGYEVGFSESTDVMPPQRLIDLFVKFLF
jgi:hypothetical protein